MSEQQAEQREVLQALSELLSEQTDGSTRISSQRRRGLSRLKAAIEDTDLETVIRSSKNDSLTAPPHGLTNPEDLKYFKLYRESFTVEHIHVPEAQRKHTRSSGGFKGAVKKQMLASRFILCARKSLATELDSELEQLLSWDDFNVNRIAQLSDRQPLLLVGLAALNHFGLLQTLCISLECAINFIKAVEHHYMCGSCLPLMWLPNPYHNSTHAADVTQALLCILTQDRLDAHFTDLELFALILSAILHDVAHPGFSNLFLTKTQDEQALMYNDQSTNEALSLSIGFKILQADECNLFVNMCREDYFYVRRLITEIILGTDMSVHGKILAQARVELASGDFWEGPDAEGRLLAMKVLMHTADISNGCRPASKAGMWTRAVYDEFFKQGDAEKEMQLDVSPLCDRDNVAIAESQKVFLSFVVAPTWALLEKIAPRSYSVANGHMVQNLRLWTELADQGNTVAVLEDPDNPSQLVHVCPISSPFHNIDRNSWGNTDMLLLLLNDDTHSIIKQGIEIINGRNGYGVSEGKEGTDSP